MRRIGTIAWALAALVSGTAPAVARETSPGPTEAQAPAPRTPGGRGSGAGGGGAAADAGDGDATAVIGGVSTTRPRAAAARGFARRVPAGPAGAPARSPAASTDVSTAATPAAGTTTAPGRSAVASASPTDEAALRAAVQAALDAAQAEVIEIVEQVPPGSAHVVRAEDLERFEHDDVHKVLATVPGVYVREEDGYGLRPNIGMRGADAERSAKIALMEDGVLIAPAPYSAPAAYYFPLVTRMASVEVLKGPASIKYGPNTVGGAVNLVTRAVPTERELALDLAGGSNLYGKLHAAIAEGSERWGILLEGIKLRTDGFKQLDGGGDTGFDKQDLQLKARIATRADARVFHELQLKAGWSGEVSNETYTGLTDADFARAPYRRYAATRLDRMDADHRQVQLQHLVRAGRLRLSTTVYRQEFARDWRKLAGLAGGRPLEDVLAHPDAGNNAVLYAILTGAADSTTPEEALIVGTNARDFMSQGVQLAGGATFGWLGATHALEVGVRLHEDEAVRHHVEDGYAMMTGVPVPDGTARRTTLDAVGSARALAAYVQHEVDLHPVRLTGGLRGELIRTRWSDRMDPARDRSATSGIVLPGVGAVVQARPWLGLLAGVHKGFVPAAPGHDPSVRAEESLNWETGARVIGGPGSAELIGFFSDYSNLKGTCTFSSGCRSDQVDDEFNGGRVHIYGVEAAARAEWGLGPVRVPAQASYTLHQARFRTSFRSANPHWGSVEVGDELPYLPTHQLAAQTGLAGERWDVALAGRFTSALRDVAGQGAPPPEELTDASLVLDASASYALPRWGKLYLTVDNVLDDTAIVSRRPYGARPGVPRMVVLGYKNTL